MPCSACSPCKPWSTYELTQQMERTLVASGRERRASSTKSRRSSSNSGWPRLRDEAVGRRPRTVYTITDAGPTGPRRVAPRARRGPGPGIRAAGQTQLRRPRNPAKTPCGPYFSDLRVGTAAQRREHRRSQGPTPTGDGPFQYRAAQGMLAGAFFTDYYAMVARWATWALERVAQSPENPADAVADLTHLAEIAQRAQWSS